MLVVLVVLWLGSVMTLQMLPVQWQAQKFAVPFSPYTPAAGMFLNLHLIGAARQALTAADTLQTLPWLQLTRWRIVVHPQVAWIGKPMHVLAAGWSSASWSMCAMGCIWPMHTMPSRQPREHLTLPGRAAHVLAV